MDLCFSQSEPPIILGPANSSAEREVELGALGEEEEEEEEEEQEEGENPLSFFFLFSIPYLDSAHPQLQLPSTVKGFDERHHQQAWHL
ncbi:hypothetical protein AOLI_G00012400 [Acnodon oligacanthus]